VRWSRCYVLTNGIQLELVNQGTLDPDINRIRGGVVLQTAVPVRIDMRLVETNRGKLRPSTWLAVPPKIVVSLDRKLSYESLSFTKESSLI
jgi:hypothetical protein